MALNLGACGGSTSAPASPAPAEAITIRITGQNGARSFSPNPASVGGRLVVFRNDDSVVHRVTLDDGTLDTGDIPPGGTSRPPLMPVVGTNYHCSIQPTMIGSVGPMSGGTPPPCEGPYC
ncbi:MAG: hypothetical protein ACE148_08025 [Vicinamibacterales bacterium]